MKSLPRRENSIFASNVSSLREVWAVLRSLSVPGAIGSPPMRDVNQGLFQGRLDQGPIGPILLTVTMSVNGMVRPCSCPPAIEVGNVTTLIQSGGTKNPAPRNQVWSRDDDIAIRARSEAAAAAPTAMPCARRDADRLFGRRGNGAARPVLRGARRHGAGVHVRACDVERVGCAAGVAALEPGAPRARQRLVLRRSAVVGRVHRHRARHSSQFDLLPGGRYLGGAAPDGRERTRA